MPEDQPRLARAVEARGGDEILAAQRVEAAAHFARKPGPAEQRDDQRDDEIDLQRRPGERDRRGEPEPERDRRHRGNHLDDALDDEIDPAAVEAGDASEDDAEQQADAHADEADRHGDARSVDQPAEQVAAELVGAEQVHRIVGLQRPDQVDVHRDEAPQLVGRAFHEEADGHDLGLVDLVDAPQRLLVDLHCVAGHVKLEACAAVRLVNEQVQRRRRRVGELRPRAVGQ